MMTLFTLSRLGFGEAFPREDEEWQYRRPDTPSWNQPDDIPAARGRKPPKEAVPTQEELGLEDIDDSPPPPPPPPRRKRVVEEPPQNQEKAFEEDRQLSSTPDPSYQAASRAEPENEAPEDPAPPHQAFRIRLGVSGGVSNLKTNDQNAQAARVEQALTQNLFLGGMLDARFVRFIGIEVDAFLGLAPDVELTDAQGGNAQIKALQQKGVLASLQGVLPLGVVVPKVGIGYGMVGLTHKHTLNSVLTETNQTVTGVFASLGIDLEVSDVVTLTVDYARSFSAESTVSSFTVGTPATEVKDANALFDRIRVGGFYQFSPRVVGGVIFHLRNLQNNTPANANNTTPTGREVFSQFLFVGMLQI